MITPTTRTGNPQEEKKTGSVMMRGHAHPGSVPDQDRGTGMVGGGVPGNVMGAGGGGDGPVPGPDRVPILVAGERGVGEAVQVSGTRRSLHSL